MIKLILSLILLTIINISFSQEELNWVTLPLDGQTHVVISHEDGSTTVTDFPGTLPAVPEEERKEIIELEKFAAWLDASFDDDRLTKADMIFRQQLYISIMKKFDAHQTVEVFKYAEQIRKQLRLDDLLTNGPIWMRKGRRL
jgi:hypothetical protein